MVRAHVGLAILTVSPEMCRVLGDMWMEHGGLTGRLQQDGHTIDLISIDTIGGGGCSVWWLVDLLPPVRSGAATLLAQRRTLTE